MCRIRAIEPEPPPASAMLPAPQSVDRRWWGVASRMPMPTGASGDMSSSPAGRSLHRYPAEEEEHLGGDLAGEYHANADVEQARRRAHRLDPCGVPGERRQHQREDEAQGHAHAKDQAVAPEQFGAPGGRRLRPEPAEVDRQRDEL